MPANTIRLRLALWVAALAIVLAALPIPNARAGEMDRSNALALLESIVAALNNGDFDAYFDAIHPDVRSQIPFSSATTGETTASYTLEVLRQRTEGDWVVVIARIAGTTTTLGEEQVVDNTGAMMFTREGDQWYMVLRGFGIELPDWVSSQIAEWELERWRADESIIPLTLGEPSDPVTVAKGEQAQLYFTIARDGFVIVQITGSNGSQLGMMTQLSSPEGSVAVMAHTTDDGQRIEVDLAAGTYGIALSSYMETSSPATITVTQLPDGELPAAARTWNIDEPSGAIAVQARSMFSVFFDVGEEGRGDAFFFVKTTLSGEPSGPADPWVYPFGATVDVSLYHSGVPMTSPFAPLLGTGGHIATTLRPGRYQFMITNAGERAAAVEIVAVRRDPETIDDLPIPVGSATETIPLRAGVPQFYTVNIRERGDYVLDISVESSGAQPSVELYRGTQYIWALNVQLNGLANKIATLDPGAYTLIAYSENDDVGFRVRFGMVPALTPGPAPTNVRLESNLPQRFQITLDKETTISIVGILDADNVPLVAEITATDSTSYAPQLARSENGTNRATVSITLPAGTYYLTFRLNAEFGTRGTLSISYVHR